MSIVISTEIYSRKIKGVLYLALILFLFTIGSGFELQALTQVIGKPAISDVSASVEMVMTQRGPLIAFNGENGEIYTSLIDSNTGLWQTHHVYTVEQGNVSSLISIDTGNGSEIILGYSLDGNLYTIISSDNGLTFSPPNPISSKSQSAGSLDLDTGTDSTVYAVFHRHQSYWDYNFASSTDGGRNFRVQYNFTSSNDSNSTGYSGHIKVKHGNIYTAYQDNNDNFAMKYAFSRNKGTSWNYTTIGNNLAFMDIAVDPGNENLVYISYINEKECGVYRSRNATAKYPIFEQIYRDAHIQFDREKVKFTDIEVAPDGTVVLVYMNNDEQYMLKTSDDNGSAWSNALPIGESKSTNLYWRSSLVVSGQTILFAFYNADLI